MAYGRVLAEEVATLDTATSSECLPSSYMPDLTRIHSFERRYRIYQLKDHGETIETYKRTESGKIVDEQVLVG